MLYKKTKSTNACAITHDFGTKVICQLVNIPAMKLVCRDYGFDCDFIADGKDVSIVLEEFGKHTLDEHGIEYSKEALMQFILRKGG